MEVYGLTVMKRSRDLSANLIAIIYIEKRPYVSQLGFFKWFDLLMAYLLICITLFVSRPSVRLNNTFFQMALPIFVSLLFLSFYAELAFGGVLFSSLPQTLIVQASPKQSQVMKAGETMSVRWVLNETLQGVDDSYKHVKVKLCYAPISQQDRAWRKTNNDISKDKTCQFQIGARAYSKDERFDWEIERDVPTATYFVRAYALDSNGNEVAFGQTTDAHKTTNLFQIQAISGRHASLDIAAACFSSFSVVSLFGFFVFERRKAKKSQQSK